MGKQFFKQPFRVLISQVEKMTGVTLELEVVTLGFRGDPLPRAVWTPPVKGLRKAGRMTVS